MPIVEAITLLKRIDNYIIAIKVTVRKLVIC